MNAPLNTPFYEAAGNEIEVFEQAWKNRLPLLIKGPTGVGKTRFVAHMAAPSSGCHCTVACHDDLTAADLVGRHLLGDGQTVWCDGPHPRRARGGICYPRRGGRSPPRHHGGHPPWPTTAACCPSTAPAAAPRPDRFMLVMSYNPGYQNFLKGLKPSTRQRFVSLRFDFPSAAREESILLGEAACDPLLARQLVSIAQRLRSLKDVDLEEVVSHPPAGMRPSSSRSASTRWKPAARRWSSLTDDVEVAEALLEVVKATFGR